jgi:hypothetical protein
MLPRCYVVLSQCYVTLLALRDATKGCTGSRDGGMHAELLTRRVIPEGTPTCCVMLLQCCVMFFQDYVVVMSSCYAMLRNAITVLGALRQISI